MRRFCIERIEAKEGKISITGQEARHIFKVLRIRKGERVVLIDARGRRFQAIIKTSGPSGVIAEIEHRLASPPRSPVNLTICQSLLKSGNMDLVIQKTSELGVDKIYPFISRRTVAVPDKKRLPGRIEHWQKIAWSTTKQSGRRSPAQIDSLYSFDSLVDILKDKEACKVILWENEVSSNLRTVLRSQPKVKNFIGIVGPEGGFEPEEIESARNSGFQPVTLGHRILRSETASMALTAIVQYECGDLSLTLPDSTQSNSD